MKTLQTNQKSKLLINKKVISNFKKTGMFEDWVTETTNTTVSLSTGLCR